MREGMGLYRGKRVDNGEWACGHLCVGSGGETYITVDSEIPFDGFDFAPVDPATVGEYTGLTDRNGVKIFEGDIVSLTKWRSNMKFSVDHSNCSFELCTGRGVACFVLSIYKPREIEVIGNIHDDRSLLGGGEET